MILTCMFLRMNTTSGHTGIQCSYEGFYVRTTPCSYEQGVGGVFVRILCGALRLLHRPRDDDRGSPEYTGRDPRCERCRPDVREVRPDPASLQQVRDRAHALEPQPATQP